MYTARKKWIACSLLSGCAIAALAPAGATEAGVRADLHNRHYPAEQAKMQDPLQEPLAVFLAGDEPGIAIASAAPGHAATDAEVTDAEAAGIAHHDAGAALPAPAGFQDWVAVDSTLLDEMRGGFDLAPGLRVSFGIERVVNLNGVLQTATRIEVPDAGKLIQIQQSPAGALLPNGVTLAPHTADDQSGSLAAPAAITAAVPGGTISLPVATSLGNGATALIQNGLGNAFAPGSLPPDTAATIIQNSANNQTIQSLTVINAATNSLELLKGANLQSTLLDALTHSAGPR